MASYLLRRPSPIGPLVAASDGERITGLWMEGQTYYAAPEGAREENLPVFEELKRWLGLYFDGKRPDFTPPLAPQGSAFRQAVWDILRAIPYGQTMTYGEIAGNLRLLGARASARSVGGAVGHNPISIVIPCHRVVGAGGRLTGYAGGIERKIWLLEREGISIH